MARKLIEMLDSMNEEIDKKKLAVNNCTNAIEEMYKYFTRTLDSNLIENELNEDNFTLTFFTNYLQKIENRIYQTQFNDNFYIDRSPIQDDHILAYEFKWKR